MPGNEFNIRQFTKDNWFRSIRMWMNIQIDIHNFHSEYADLNQQWYRFKKDPLNHPEPQPPKLSNFTVIPMCTFKRRNFRIDTDALWHVLNKIDLLPTVKGLLTVKGVQKWRKMTKNEFYANIPTYWGIYFDLNKINNLVKYKKQFHYQIVTDGVSVTVLYKRPEHKECEPSDAEVEQRRANGEFANEIGFDPGMRTYIAGVIYNFFTGREVIFLYIFYQIVINLLFFFILFTEQHQDFV